MAKFVDFTNPPVVEVVASVVFEIPESLNPALLGVYWDSIKDDFPNLSQDKIVATPDTIDRHFIGDIPPLPRVQFLTTNGRKLIQLQSDRFFYNWKRIQKEDYYPSYDEIIHEFLNRWIEFKSFLDKEGIGPPTVKGLELLYVNHIDLDNGLSKACDAEWLVDHKSNSNANRFLPNPASINWSTAYDMPEGCGKLIVSVRNGSYTATGDPLIRLDLTARGSPNVDEEDMPEEFMKKWFDIGREWIVKGFCDITDESVHKKWGRTK